MAAVKEVSLGCLEIREGGGSLTLFGLPFFLTASSWIFGVLSWFLKGKGIIVNTRKGLTTFGEGLADDEIQYLHAIVRRALTG